MKDIIGNIFGFLYTLSMGDYIFFGLTFLLILIFVYMIFLIRKEDYVNSDIDNLENIKKQIEEEYKPESIVLTEYEEEQEKNAIISYDELIKNKDKYKVNYDEDYISDTTEIDIKKISLEETNLKEETKSSLNVKLMSYDKEEAFLVALKQLQQNLLN